MVQGQFWLYRDFQASLGYLRPRFIKPIIGAGEVAELVGEVALALPGSHPWIPSPAPHKPGMVLPACHPNTQEVEAGGS